MLYKIKYQTKTEKQKKNGFNICMIYKIKYQTKTEKQKKNLDGSDFLSIKI